MQTSIVLLVIRMSWISLSIISTAGMKLENSTLSVSQKEQHMKGGSTFAFASYYSDHMVLQRAPQASTIWGYAALADIGKEVSVTVMSDDTSVTTTNTHVYKGPFSDKAMWFVTLKPTSADTPHIVMAKLSGYKTLSLVDVLFGDVWLCSGQSNMQFTLMQMFEHQAEVLDAKNNDKIRLLNIARVTSVLPLYDVKTIISPWSPPADNFQTSRKGVDDWTGFSAVCYMYGKYLHHILGYPIGLVDSTWGGTPVEAWSDPEALAKCGLDKMHDKYVMSEELKIDDDPPPHQNSVLWNAMIHPLANMTIKGAIWYQGEANTQYHTEYYGCSFPRMIESWRYHFRQGTRNQVPQDMPFGFVQIGPMFTDTISKDFGYPTIRWHQMMDDPVGNPMKNTFMAVAMDLTDPLSPYGSVHIRDKKSVALRLANAAMNRIYQPGSPVGSFPFPTQETVNLKHNQMIVQFSYGLAQINVRNQSGFEVCCASSYSACPLNETTNWLPSIITKSNSTSVWLSWTQCESEISAYRYAWRSSPCIYHQCAVYSDLTGDPLPTFTKILQNSEPSKKRPGLTFKNDIKYFERF